MLFHTPHTILCLKDVNFLYTVITPWKSIYSSTHLHTLTKSWWRETQVFHACADQSVKFLSLRATEKVKSLLADAFGGAPHSLGPAGASSTLTTQPPCPLHALPPQQRVVHGLRGRGWFGRGWVTVRTGSAEQRLTGLSRVLIILHCDRHLRLKQTKTNVFLISYFFVLLYSLWRVIYSSGRVPLRRAVCVLQCGIFQWECLLLRSTASGTDAHMYGSTNPPLWSSSIMRNIRASSLSFHYNHHHYPHNRSDTIQLQLSWVI